MAKRIRAAAPRYGQLIVEQVKQNPDYLVDQIMELFDNSRGYSSDDSEIIEWFADQVKGKREWQLYRDGREVYIATNVKGQGFPDYDEVIESAARQAKVDEDRVRRYVTPQFFDDMFWDAVRFEIENFDPSISVVGKSSGYWGVPWDPSWIEVDRKVVKDRLAQLLRDNRALTAISEKMSKSQDPTAGVENAILSYVEDSWNLFDFLHVTDPAKQMFKQIGDQIAATVKDFESPDRWADDIVSNQWWEASDVEGRVLATLDHVAERLEQYGKPELAQEIDVMALPFKKVTAGLDHRALERAVKEQGFEFVHDPHVAIQQFEHDLKRYGLQRAGTELFRNLQHDRLDKTQEGNFLMMLKRLVGVQAAASASHEILDEIAEVLDQAGRHDLAAAVDAEAADLDDHTGPKSLIATLDEVAAVLEAKDPALAAQIDQVSQSLAQDEEVPAATKPSPETLKIAQILPYINDAVHRFKQEGSRGVDWTWDRVMNSDDRAEFEHTLVQVKHPLAREPGTNENRFRDIVRELAGK